MISKEDNWQATDINNNREIDCIIFNAFDAIGETGAPPEECIFAVLIWAAKAAYDMAPNDAVASQTIEAGIEHGKKLAFEGNQQQKRGK